MKLKISMSAPLLSSKLPTSVEVLRALRRSILAFPNSLERSCALRRLGDRIRYYSDHLRMLERARKYQQSNAGKLKRKQYVASPLVKQRRRDRENAAYAADPSKKRAQVYDYRTRNPDANRKATAAWRAKDPKHARKIRQAWYYANKPNHAEQHRRYKLRRRKADPAFKALGNLRRRLNLAVRNAATTKAGTTLKLLGCTPATLVAHLESQFQPGMSWQNYGLRGWHIDHRKPCESFDLTDPAQQRACFHYTNLQPMWWMDNIAKGHRRVP